MIEYTSVSPRRGASSPATLVSVVVGLALAAGGFFLGRFTDSPAEGGGPPQPAAAIPAAVPTGGGSAPRSPTPAVDAEAAADDPDQSPAGPVPYEFDPPVLDFGVVAADGEVTGTFHVRNVGAEPLRILTMKPSCTCTTLEDLTGTVVAPGDSVAVSAIMDGRSYVGEKKSQVKFVFADHGPATYQIVALVSRAVQAEPPYISALEETSGSITVRSIDDRSFRVLSANGKPAVYADGFDPGRDEPRTEYQLAWSVEDFDPSTCRDADGNLMRLWWVVETDHPKAPLIDVRLRQMPCTKLEAPKAGRQWFVSPPRAVLGAIAPGGSAEFTVEMKGFRGFQPRPATVLRAESESDDFHAELIGAESEAGRIVYRVRVTPEEGHRGLVYGTVRFYGRFQGQSQGVVAIATVQDDGESRAAAPSADGGGGPSS